MSTYKDNRARQQRVRRSNIDPAVNDRVGAFLRFLAGPITYNQGIVDARTKAMERGPKIPFLPEFGLTEGVQSYFDQAGRDLSTAFLASDPRGVEPTVLESADSPRAAEQNFLQQQYQRYYKTPEFDGVFGAGARGTGAPEDAAAMEVLGNQLMAPEKDTNIASMYAAQSAMGRVNQDKIQDYFADTNLPGNVKLKDGRTALQAWAKENPMLAQREYMKAEAERVANMPDNTQYDTGTAVRGEMPGTVEQQIRYGAGSPISKSPTEYDISNSDEEEFQKVYDQLFARSKAAK